MYIRNKLNPIIIEYALLSADPGSEVEELWYEWEYFLFVYLSMRDRHSHCTWWKNIWVNVFSIEYVWSINA